MTGVLNLANDFCQKFAAINGERVQALGFAVFNFLDIILVEAH